MVDIMSLTFSAVAGICFFSGVAILVRGKEC